VHALIQHVKWQWNTEKLVWKQMMGIKKYFAWDQQALMPCCWKILNFLALSAWKLTRRNTLKIKNWGGTHIAKSFYFHVTFPHAKVFHAEQGGTNLNTLPTKFWRSRMDIFNGLGVISSQSLVKWWRHLCSKCSLDAEHQLLFYKVTPKSQSAPGFILNPKEGPLSSYSCFSLSAFALSKAGTFIRWKKAKT